jgi:CheY-like chemotaxis protein/DNA-directed RNA polymerase specialized sigma24 family protein
MAAGQEITPHIPYLRRFGRALTGSQESGDACVYTALEAILADPSIIRGGKTPRSSLYRIFLSQWEMSPHRDPVGIQSPDELSARQQLASIEERARVAFLLSALEGFDVNDVAFILRASTSDAEELLAQAAVDIADQLRTDVLIIEDEPFIALDLKSLLEDLGHNIIGIAKTHVEAIQVVAHNTPGLILADIQLADGSSGLEAVNQILQDLETPVIFVTAFPERFLTGKAPEPAFLVTKPFGVDSLKAVISQALFFNRRSRRSVNDTDRTDVTTNISS